MIRLFQRLRELKEAWANNQAKKQYSEGYNYALEVLNEYGRSGYSSLMDMVDRQIEFNNFDRGVLDACASWTKAQ